MKILLISHMPPPTTGIGSWTRRVLESGIPDTKIDFINSNMIGGRDSYENRRIVLKDEVNRCFTIWKKEIDFLKKNHNDIVHTNIPCTVLGMVREFITGIIAKVFGAKFIVHCHCTLSNVVNTGFKKSLFKLLSKLTDGYIVLNTASEEFVKKYTRNKVEIIPNFVCDYELPSASDRIIEQSVRNILFVGGVSADKGCDTVIKAASGMKNIKFHLVGMVSPEIKAMEIPKNVILYGNKDKDFVQDIMRKSDVFVFMSRYFGEGFSVALVEAMAAGLPCIVTDWAANADMIGRNHEGGIVVPQLDYKAFQNAIEELQNQVTRKKMSKRNMDTVRKSYTNSNVTTQISGFYRYVMGDNNG